MGRKARSDRGNLAKGTPTPALDTITLLTAGDCTTSASSALTRWKTPAAGAGPKACAAFLLLAVALILGSMLASATAPDQAHAAELMAQSKALKALPTSNIPPKSGSYWAVLHGNERDWERSMTVSKGKLSNVKSSNKSIVKIVGPYSSGFDYELLKPGKATISYKLNGKPYSFSIKVLKYASPVKVFKVGSKNYANAFKKRETRPAKASRLSGKIRVKPNANWKITAIQVGGPGMKPKPVKNGYSIKAKSNITFVDVTAKNKKTGVEEWVALFATG